MPVSDQPIKQAKLWFVGAMFIAAAVIVAAGLLYYRHVAKVLREAVEQQLHSVTGLKAQELESWRRERLSDARFYQNNLPFQKLVQNCVGSTANPAQQRELAHWMADTRESHKYDILLLDKSGQVRFSMPENSEPLSTAEMARLPDSQAPSWIDLHTLPGSDRMVLSLLLPIRAPEPETGTAAFLLLRINPADYLYPTLRSWPVPSDTAESLLVRRDGDQVSFLSPLRFAPKAGLSTTLPLTRTDSPEVQAALGRTGIFTGPDYRETSVITVIAKVEDSPWMLVTHINRAEAEAPLLKQRTEIIFVTITLVVAALAVIGFFWRQYLLRYFQQLQRTAARLAESEQQLSGLLEASPVILYTLRWDETAPQTTYVSGNVERILGYTSQEALQPGWWHEHLHPEDQAGAAGFLPLLAKASEDRFAHDYRFLLKDGRTVVVHDQLRLVRDAAGRPAEIVGAWTDVTEEKARLEELRLKSAALDAAANAIMITTANGTIVWANAAFTQLTGYSLGETIQSHPRLLLKSGEQPEEFYRKLWDTILSGKPWSGELVNRRKDGTHYHEEMTITPVPGADGRITHFIAIKQDVTEKKLLQEQYLRAQRLESLGMLASGIAHDLNNMLAPIVFSGPLLRQCVTAPADLRIIDMLEKSAERGTALVKQVVAFAQGGTNALRLTQLKHVARDAVAFVQSTFPKSIRVENKIATDAWPVNANPSQIHQILLNLCVNARDAMPDGGRLTIALHNRTLTNEEAGAIEGARAGDWLVLEVADTGTGILPEILPRIFDSFFTTKAQGKGTGLGLTTVRSIVTAHRGFIEVKTGIGQGTTFRVYFMAETTAPVFTEEANQDAIPIGQGELILLVDDDPAIRDSLGAVLIQGGYRVISCADGVEAIVSYQAKPREINLVITDVDMPHLNGAVLAATLRQLKPELPIIAMSGLTSATNSKVTEVKKIVHAYLEKPFNARELLRLISQLLHRGT